VIEADELKPFGLEPLRVSKLWFDEDVGSNSILALAF
jgi:hypothetical protein